MAVLYSSEIVYPETDGKPMTENTVQYRWITVIKDELEELTQDQTVFVAGDLFWYPVEYRPDIVATPDVMAAFGRPKGDRSSFRQWEEGGTAPQVVFEIRSPSNSDDDMDEKRAFYDQHGVEEYYIYDPNEHILQGWQRRKRGLGEIRKMNGWISPRFGIRFDMSNGDLRIFRPDGRPFVTRQERILQFQVEREQVAAKLQTVEDAIQRERKVKDTNGDEVKS